MVFFTYDARAHMNGASLEAEAGELTIDIGVPERFKVGEPTVFDFALRNSDTMKAEPFTGVWVSLQQDNEYLYAGMLHNPLLGPTTMFYRFYDSGTYTLSTRFQSGTTSLAASEFNFVVTDSAETNSIDRFTMYNVALIFSMVLAGILCGVYVNRYFCRRGSMK